MSELKRICIVCPSGCHLTIIRVADGEAAVFGNRCPRGRAYALNELRDPRRTVTFGVRMASGRFPVLPVRTSEPVPKRLIPELLTELKLLCVPAPVKIGDIALKNFAKTGVDVIFTRSSEFTTVENNDGSTD